MVTDRGNILVTTDQLTMNVSPLLAKEAPINCLLLSSRFSFAVSVGRRKGGREGGR